MVSLRLALDRRAYFPYDRVQGRLSIITKTPCTLDTLSILATKTQRLEICKKGETRPILPSRDDEGSTPRKRLFHIISNRELCAGEHIFPFSFVLSGSESASTRLNERFNGLHCIFENNCQLEAVGEVGGKRETVQAEVPIYNRLDSIPYVDIKFKIDTLLCLRRSVYLYRIVTDRTFYKTGDVVCVNCFPTSICPRSLVHSIDISLHEIASYSDKHANILGDRLISTGSCIRLDKNEFRAEVRLPFNLCGTVSNAKFTVQTALLFTIHFHRGWPLKIKKYIDVGRAMISIPEIEEASVFSGIQYNEALLEF